MRREGDMETVLKGWCKDCERVREMDRDLGGCVCCGSRQVSARRPAPPALPLLEEAA